VTKRLNINANRHGCTPYRPARVTLDPPAGPLAMSRSPGRLGLPGDGAAEPGHVGLVTLACLPLAFEERIGLPQYQRVTPPTAQVLVVHRQLPPVDPGVDVASVLLCQRPLERAPCRVAEERAQGRAQLAVASLRKLDRPVIGGPGRPGEPSLKPSGAVPGDD